MISAQLRRRTTCPETPNVYKGRKSAQDAHEAIRPTRRDLFAPEKVKASLTRDQYRPL